MGKYEDIIYLDRPVSDRPKMPRADRAKIFQPFAALKGHDELIAQKHKIMVERIRLSEERKDELDQTIKILQKSIAEGKLINAMVRHFICDEKASIEQGRELGNYVDTCGVIRKIDMHKGVVILEELEIKAQDVLAVRW